MADITLAEFSSQAWLVKGEQHIDDLLANTLPPNLSIEVVVCESKSAVDALWRENGGDDMDMMWLIHPGIVRRSKGLGGKLSVQFAEWSASLDDQAQTALQTAAALLAKDPHTRLTLLRHAAADAPPMAAEMANLRTGLIEARLAALGVDPARLERETQPAESPTQPDQLDLLIRPAPA